MPARRALREKKAGQLEEGRLLRSCGTACFSGEGESSRALNYWFIYETDAVECRKDGIEPEAQVDLAQGALCEGRVDILSPVVATLSYSRANKHQGSLERCGAGFDKVRGLRDAEPGTHICFSLFLVVTEARAGGAHLVADVLQLFGSLKDLLLTRLCGQQGPVAETHGRSGNDQFPLSRFCPPGSETL